jgi:pyruvyltransferase
MANKKYIEAFWYSSNNVGDNLNHLLIQELSGKTPVLAADRTKPHYICCGSILGEYTEASMIWGAGFFYDHQKLNFDIPVYAVRGELTRKAVGKDVPVGDPALLLPKIHHPFVPKEHKIGIIPHWSNVKKAIEKYPDIHIVDPMQSVIDFVEDVLSCEYIFSKSLHGLIISDAYEVKNCWLDIGGDAGGSFKYLDYYSTVKGTVNHTDGIDISLCNVHEYKYDLETLLNSCPFYNGKSE